jgi:cell division septation protein DedD
MGEVFEAMGPTDTTWPDAVTIVLAAEGPRQRRWALATTIQIARKLATERRVVLADVQVRWPAALADALEVEAGRGIVDVLFRGASFSDVASRPGVEQFFFLPVGSAPPPLQVLYHHPRWRKIAARLTEAKAHLLPCVDSRDWLDAGPIPGFEACIVLNAGGSEIELPSGARKLAELLAPPEIREETPGPLEDAATAPEPEPETEIEAAGAEDVLSEAPPGASTTEAESVAQEPAAQAADRPAEPQQPVSRVLIEPARRTPRPHRRIGVAAAALVAAAVLVFIVWRAMGSGQPAAEGEPAEAAADTVTLAQPEVEPGESQPTPRPREVSLPYSVVIASYSSFDDAREAQERWLRADRPVYVAPTPVRGVIWNRVYAGVLAEREAAEELMAQLVREGIKDTLRAWDVRPTRYAFAFGTHANLGAPEAVVETLLVKGIPAYLVQVPSAGPEGGLAYHVYAGGYESPESASPLRELIERAGLEDVELVERVGMVPQ